MCEIDVLPKQKVRKIEGSAGGKGSTDTSKATMVGGEIEKRAKAHKG